MTYRTPPRCTPGDATHSTYIGTLGSCDVWAHFEPESWSLDDMGACLGTVVPRSSLHEDYERTLEGGGAWDRKAWTPGAVSKWGVYDDARKRGASRQVAREREAAFVRETYEYVSRLYAGDVEYGTVVVQVVSDDRETGVACLGGTTFYPWGEDRRADLFETTADRLRRRRSDAAKAARWPDAERGAMWDRALLGAALDNDLDTEAIADAVASLEAALAGVGASVARKVRALDALRGATDGE